jgi:hypothetical protein
MRTPSILVVAALCLAGAAPARAQTDQWFGASWQMAQGLANTHDFTPAYSFRGMGLEWRWVHGNTSFGLNAAWNVMDDVRTETASVGGVDITGKQFRYVNAWPILLSAHFYIGKQDGPRAYLGVNGGTYYIERLVDVGTFEVKDHNWHGGVAPEVGFAFPLRGGMGNTAFFTSARYNYAFAAGDAPYQSWISVHVGFAWRSLGGI